MWAFGTSPHGLGLPGRTLWSLEVREYDALKAVWQDARDFQTGLVSALRADLHNTGFRDFGQTFEPGDFDPRKAAAVEDRVAELVEAGWNPAAAVAAVTSKQSKDRQLHLINKLHGAPAAGRGRTKRA